MQTQATLSLPADLGLECQRDRAAASGVRIFSPQIHSTSGEGNLRRKNAEAEVVGIHIAKVVSFENAINSPIGRSRCVARI
jgi:hypothetical protein